MKLATQLACDHWGYIESLLKEHGEPDHLINIIGFHYKTAFEHGYKHAVEACKGTYTIKPNIIDGGILNERISGMDKINSDLPSEQSLGLSYKRPYIGSGGSCREVQKDNSRQERNSGCACGIADCK